MDCEDDDECCEQFECMKYRKETEYTCRTKGSGGDVEHGDMNKVRYDFGDFVRRLTAVVAEEW